MTGSAVLIHKRLQADDQLTLLVHVPGRWLHVDEQHGRVTIWYEESHDGPLRDVGVHVLPTGITAPSDIDYVGTVLSSGGPYGRRGELVWARLRGEPRVTNLGRVTTQLQPLRARRPARLRVGGTPRPPAQPLGKVLWLGSRTGLGL